MSSRFMQQLVQPRLTDSSTGFNHRGEKTPQQQEIVNHSNQ